MRSVSEAVCAGDAVKLVDSSLTGTVVAVGSGEVTVDVDGMEIRVPAAGVAPYSGAQNEMMARSRVSRKDARPVRSSSARRHSDRDVVDLHIERLPGGESAPENRRLAFQMDAFHSEMRRSSGRSGRRVVFVHGIGEGVLRQAIEAELNGRYAGICRWSRAPFDLYMGSAVSVTFR